MYQVIYVSTNDFLMLLVARITNSMQPNLSNKKSELIDLHNEEF